MSRLAFFDRDRFHEARRRITRGTLKSLLRKSEARLRSPQSLSTESIHRILICRPNHRLGNLVLLTPLVAELQRLFPTARVDIVVAGHQGAELFRAFPNIGHVYALHRRMVRHPIAVIRTAVQIRRARYDLAIDPCESSQSSRLLVAIAKARYTISLPRTEAAGKIAQPIPMHMAKWPVALLRRALSRGQTADARVDYPCLDLRLSSMERRSAALVMSRLVPGQGSSATGTIIGIFADATGAKKYGENWWTGFLEELRNRLGDCGIVEIAPPDGHSRLSSAFPTFSSPDAREVAAFISNLTCFISADCGVMHLASASGIPTIGLFSTTDPEKYEPYGNGSQAIQTSGKAPAAVAQLASAIIERIRMRGIPQGTSFDGHSQTSLGAPP